MKLHIFIIYYHIILSLNNIHSEVPVYLQVLESAESACGWHSITSTAREALGLLAEGVEGVRLRGTAENGNGNCTQFLTTLKYFKRDGTYLLDLI